MQDQKEIMATAHDYLERFDNGCKCIIELFREGEESEALKLLPDAIEGLQWLSEVFELTKESHTGKLDYVEINNVLKNIEEALQDIDYILLSDLLEYEVLPITDKWIEQIKTLLD